MSSHDDEFTEAFWRHKPLAELTDAEWESLCDGCGRCCLCKLEDEDSGELYYTNVACRLLDLERCRCSDYARRAQLVPDCLVLRQATTAQLGWLPPTCAYRLVGQGAELPPWHPLVSGTPDTVHAAGISVCGKVVSEDSVRSERLAEHIITWW